MQNLTPRQIVSELDRYIIGQGEAKRAVAVAIRNRWRRQQLDPEFAPEVSPKNIIMLGPTGVGKTEIARRIAGLTGAPFMKVEASKFTEVGYHGRDVESMIRDLVEQAIKLVRAEHAAAVRERAEAAVEDRLLDLLLPDSAGRSSSEGEWDRGSSSGGFVEDDQSVERRQRLRERMRHQLQEGELEEREVEVSIQQKAVSMNMFSNMGLDQMDPEMSKMFENLVPDQTTRRRMPIREARDVLMQQETDKLIDREKLTEQAIERTEQSGIIFLDEIDKVASPSESQGKGGSADISRQGVQRDLLPIVEGSTVSTRHGMVNTEHILFIAAGAFHSSSVSDLMPELQGRFPIRVELDDLTRDDFVRILTEPHNSLTRQQRELLATEGLEVQFSDEAIQAMAELAARVNTQTENIGARRLMTIVEKLFEQVNFDAPDMAADGKTELKITDQMVRDQVSAIAEDEDLSKFVL